MRDYESEFQKRVEWIRALVGSAHARGVVFGNSGGKDSALAGILCKAACDRTVGLILPCGSKRNYGADADDAKTLADAYGIETRTIDLSPAREALLAALAGEEKLSDAAVINLAPRLRMTALYAVAADEGLLVAGTGNRSERYMGYFTKWGDGASDFNPIADLTAGEVFEFLEYLRAPRQIIDKAPSAGLFDGQTDEQEMGVRYAAIDAYILTGTASESDRAIIERYHRQSGHKRTGTAFYSDTEGE